MKAFITPIILLFSLAGFSQVQDPVSWQATATSTSSDTALVTFRASIEKGWHIYSMEQNIKNGPVATSFSLVSLRPDASCFFDVSFY